MKVIITGASDDLIEVDGDIVEEFGASTKGTNLLAVSDGTLLRITYDNDGIWRIGRLVTGSAEFVKVEGDVPADTFDKVTLTGDIKWIVVGEHYAAPSK